jgi:hypothetical protein
MKSAIAVSVCLLIVLMAILLVDDIGLKHVAVVILFSAQMIVLAIGGIGGR